MGNIAELNAIVDEIFYVLEEVKGMLGNWNASYHTPFIAMVMRLNALRDHLRKSGYTDDFVDTLTKIAYHNVFSQDTTSAHPAP